MLRWLFRRPVTREEAIARATELLSADGCRVIAPDAEVDWSEEAIPLRFLTANIPGRRWLIEFERLTPPGMWRSHTRTTVYVWADTGRATFDAFEEAP